MPYFVAGIDFWSKAEALKNVFNMECIHAKFRNKRVCWLLVIISTFFNYQSFLVKSLHSEVTMPALIKPMLSILIQQFYINQGSRVCPLWHQPSNKNKDWCGSLINWWNNIERLKCFWQMVINPGSCVRLGLPMLLVVQSIHNRWTPSAHRYIMFYRWADI